MKKGFTLAEVLITLGIIGVVAALTLPTLTANTQTAKIGPKLAKAVSSFEQANEALLSANSVDAVSDIEYDDASAYFNALTNYIKGTVISSSGSVTLMTHDNTAYIIGSISAPTTTNAPHKNKIGSIVVNINPNAEISEQGTNLFNFTLWDDGSLRPQGAREWNGDSGDVTWKDKCPKDAKPTAPEYCAGHIFENNLKVLYK